MSYSLNHSNDSFKQTDSFRNETTDMSESLNHSINSFIQTYCYILEINASNVLLKVEQQSIPFLFRSVGPTLVNAAKLYIFTGDIMSYMKVTHY